MKLFYGALLIVLAQVLTFVQLQSQSRFGWAREHPYIMMFMGIPISYLFINSTRLMNDYTGQTWPGRIIGQTIGIVIFSIMAWLVFREPITIKTGVCILLAFCVVLIQIFWK